jgi:ABC-type polar amino acid transport system ATPase subunit
MKVERVQPNAIRVEIEMSFQEWRLFRKLLVANVTVPRALLEGAWIEESEHEALVEIMNSIRIGVEG